MKKNRTKRGAGGKANRKLKRKRTVMRRHVEELQPLLSETLIEEIAASEAGNMSDSGSPGAHNHNTRTIMHAIRRALDSVPGARIVR